MPAKQREIYLVPFPYSDLSSSKKRPALVLSKSNFNKGEKKCIVCAITSNLDHNNCTRITNDDFETGGLFEKESAVLYGVLFTISAGSLGKKLVRLKDDKFSEINKNTIKLIDS